MKLFKAYELQAHILWTLKAQRLNADFADYSYHPVTRKWVLDAWEAWVSSLPGCLKHLRQGPAGGRQYPLWVAGAGDCDNHALDFMAFCSRQNWMNSVKRRVRRDGLGVLRMNYMAEARPEDGRSGGHSKNLILLNDDGDLLLEAFEPADGVFTLMTQNERESIWFVQAA